MFNSFGTTTTEADLRNYLLDLVDRTGDDPNGSASYLNQAVYALRFLFSCVVKRPRPHLSISTVEKVLATARKKADIPQKVTPRIVQHSFAVHLLEAGINIRYVQALIGHENVKSTQVYDLVSRKTYQQIQNPLDALFKKDVNKKMNP